MREYDTHMKSEKFPSGTGSYVAIKGHPVHPMLVPLVIGSFFCFFICEYIDWTNTSVAWSDAASLLLRITLATTLLAAVPGVMDLISISRAMGSRAGRIHGTINTVFFLTCLSNSLARDSSVPPSNSLFLLSVVSGTLLLAAGWFGGEMVFRQGVGVSRAVGNNNDFATHAVPSKDASADPMRSAVEDQGGMTQQRQERTVPHRSPGVSSAQGRPERR